MSCLAPCGSGTLNDGVGFRHRLVHPIGVIESHRVVRPTAAFVDKPLAYSSHQLPVLTAGDEHARFLPRLVAELRCQALVQLVESASQVQGATVAVRNAAHVKSPG